MRKLFDLDLLDLVEAVFVMKDNLGPALARTVFEHVACCLPVDRTPAWWVDAHAAAALRQEAAPTAPPCARAPTRPRRSRPSCAGRSRSRPDEVRAIAGPFSGQVGPGGLPLDMVAEIFAEIRRKSGVREQDWANDAKSGLAEKAVRLGNRFYSLRIDAPPDAEQLRALVDLFGGMRFLIARRGLALPADIDNVLLDLLPEVDPDAEVSALAFSRQLDDRLEA